MKPYCYVLDEDGTPTPIPADSLQYAILWKNQGRRRLASTHLDGAWVSTVFLSIDHGMFANSRPVLWETMVFCDDTEHEMHEYQNRYTSAEDAAARHRAVVSLLKDEYGFAEKEESSHEPSKKDLRDDSEHDSL